jgi:O-antigen/teichoic acid export membrane protein
MKSLKYNIIWNSAGIGANLLFPIITFPYISRILGPELIGEFNYVSTIVSYFILFANMGFPIYGMRAVSRCRENISECSKIASGIFFANLISVAMVYFLYWGFYLFFIRQNRLLYFVIGISILVSCFSLDWFYQGIEDYKYITIRSLIIKCISVFLLLIFVKNQEDIIIYAIISLVATSGNNFFNFYRVRKYICLNFSLKESIKHIKGSSVLFLGTIAVSIYTQLNVVMLGYLDNTVAVGYFVTGNKIVSLCLTIVNAATASIVPRISYLIGTGKIEDAGLLQRKIITLILYLTIPLTIGLIICSKEIILFFGGQDFLPAVSILKILSFLIVIISLSGFLGKQVLIPIGKEKYGNYCTIMGAIITLILNIILIPRLSFIGTAIAALVGESVVTVSHYCFARKYMSLKLIEFFTWKAIVSTAIMGIGVFFLVAVINNYLFIFLYLIIGMVIYFASLSFLKDDFVIDLFKTLVSLKGK